MPAKCKINLIFCLTFTHTIISIQKAQKPFAQYSYYACLTEAMFFLQNFLLPLLFLVSLQLRTIARIINLKYNVFPCLKNEPRDKGSRAVSETSTTIPPRTLSLSLSLSLTMTPVT